MKKHFTSLIFFFCFASSIITYAQTAEIQTCNYQCTSYFQGQQVYVKIEIKNTGSIALSGLWLEVGLTSRFFGFELREGWWKDLPTLIPGENYTTGYDILLTVPSDAPGGCYHTNVTLRDSDLIYDYKQYITYLIVSEVATLNGPTPLVTIGNPFSQPNITQQIGLDSLEWYGSGDVNLDNKINQEDLDLMNQGIQNNMADIDGDGIFSTQNDKSILSEYLNGIRDYLPGWWNELTIPEEREDWVAKMMAINDGIMGGIPYWLCGDYIKQMQLDFYGCSNYIEGYNQGYWKPETHIDSVAKFNLPFYKFGSTTTSGVSHAIGGFLVGRRINTDSISYNPLEFNDWYFVGYNNDERVYPGNWNMDPNHYVQGLYTSAYIHQRYPPYQNDFTSTFNEILWELNNGVATLINNNPFECEYGITYANPNIIKVLVADLTNIVLSGANVLPNQTMLTPEILDGLGYNAVPDTTKENTILPINLTYSDRDTIWNSDSTNFSFYRKFLAWIYSGGYTKWDTTSHKITIIDLIGPYVTVHVGSLDSIVVNGAQIPFGQQLTPEFLDSLGYNAIPDTTKENTILPINLTYLDRDTVWYQDSTSYSFDRDFFAWLYSFADTLTDGPSTQNIKVDNIVFIDALEEERVKDYKISQNYPNPANPSTTIRYQIPKGGRVLLRIYNVLGAEVATLVDEEQNEGGYEVKFDALKLASGVYIYRLQVNEFVASKKMILMK